MDVDEDVRNGNVANGESISVEYDPAKFNVLYVKNLHSTVSDNFIVPKRYVNLQFLNAGAQGTVVQADDLVTRQKVAIKKMHRPFIMPMSAKRAYREFILLTTIRHPNIIKLISAFSPQTRIDTFQEVYLVMELMTHNLHEVVNRLRLEHKMLSFFVYQMLCGIKHLHNSGIIHRDLKPSNIVVNDKCELKVLDFGLARKKNIDNAMRMSDYVVTRYYRAPEVILGLQYSEKVDIWSIGCIFAEMISHNVLFPGTDRVDQWTKIVQLLGTPTEDFIQQLGQATAMYVRALKRHPGRTMEELFPDSMFQRETENPRAHLTADYARDLLGKMLVVDPALRFSVEDALNHPYVKLWYKDEEVNSPASENRYDAAIDLAEKPLTEWKQLMFEEVKRFQMNHDVFGDGSI